MVEYSRSYYHDRETGLYYLNARYYNPQWRRFISPDSTAYLDPDSVNGLNLYVYTGNNPISEICHNSSLACGRDISHESLSFRQSSISSNSGDFNISGSIVSNLPKTNHVLMHHYTISLVKDPTLAWMTGNISYTQTKQWNSAETFYSFTNIGNDGYSVGVGMNLGNWLGISGYLTSDIGFGASVQATPWLIAGAGWSLESGLSVSGGIIVGSTTHEITVTVGNGPILLYATCVAVAALSIPGAKAIAATAAGVIFIIDLWN